jgi:fused signal recognition particle receptor
VQKELGIPVKFVGIGEQIDDLKQFVPEEFAEQIV